MADPATWAIIITGTSAVVSAYSERQAEKAEESRLKYNAAVAERDAEAKEQAKVIEQNQKRKDTRKLLARQRAAIAAGGVVGTEGTPVTLQEVTAEDETFDLLMIGHKFDVAAARDRSRATGLRQQAKEARAEGRRGVGTALFSGAADIAAIKIEQNLAKKQRVR